MLWYRKVAISELMYSTNRSILISIIILVTYTCGKYRISFFEAVFFRDVLSIFSTFVFDIDGSRFDIRLFEICSYLL